MCAENSAYQQEKQKNYRSDLEIQIDYNVKSCSEKC